MSRERLINACLGIVLAAVPLAAMLFGKIYIVTLAAKVAILALAGAGLNIVLGLGGLVSFGHAAFFGLGGYAAGILASEEITQMPLIWLAAVAVSGLAALPIGALSLRTAGVYFIMITLAFAQMIYYFAVSWPAYGGEDGLSIGVRNSFPGLNTLDPLTFFAICFALLMAALLISSRLAASRFGLALEAARQNELRLASVGIGPFGVRLTAFVISAMITGLAGALYADLNRFVSPSMLSWQTSGEIIVFVILGGIGRLFGPLAGAMLYIALEQALSGVSEHWQFLLGFLVLGIVLFARGGLIGLLAGERRHG